jgi:hypothetical protein
MEQFKHLQLPASVKKHYVKLVATGIILTIILLMWQQHSGVETPDPLLIDSIDSTDTEGLA